MFRGWSDVALNSVKGFHTFHTPASGCSGGFGYLFLTADDEMFGFGHNCGNVNILGLPRSDAHYRQENILNPTKIDTLSGKRIKQISIGGQVGAAVTACGTLLWWGLCYENDGIIMCPRSPAAAARRRFLRVACGYQLMAALSAAYKVQVWGRVSEGQRFFQGERLNLDAPVIAVSCGLHHLAMLDKDGFVHTWGQGEQGQRGLVLRSPEQQYLVLKLSDEPCSLVKCGPYSTYCLTAMFQEIYACGSNGRCSLSSFSKACPKSNLSRIDFHDPITDMAIVHQPNNNELVVACTSEGEFYTWGSTHYPALTEASSMIGVFALWNTTPGLTHISCLPSISSSVNHRTYKLEADVLKFIYLRARPELGREIDTFLRSCKTTNLRYYASQIVSKEKSAPFMLKKFLLDLTSRNQIPPADCTDFEELDSSDDPGDSKVGFQNWLEVQSSKSTFSLSTSYQSSHPRTLNHSRHHLWSQC